MQKQKTNFSRTKHLLVATAVAAAVFFPSFKMNPDSILPRTSVPAAFAKKNNLDQKIKVLIKQLESEDDKVQGKAIKELKMIGRPAVRALMDALAHENTRVGVAAVVVLTQIELSRDEIQDMINLITGGKYWQERAAAVLFVKHSPEKIRHDALANLVKAMQTDKSDAGRDACLLVFWYEMSETIRMLGYHRNKEVRQAAAAALGKGAENQISVFCDNGTTIMRTGYSSKPPFSLINAPLRVYEKEAVPELSRAAKNPNEDQGVRDAAAKALAVIKKRTSE